MPDVDLPIVSDVRSLIPPSLQRTVRRSLSRGPEAGIPARALFGVLPIKRLIPQDVHSLLDYASGLTLAGVALCTKAPACNAGLALGLSITGVSLLTDYRLSLRKIIPIEVHESLDYLWGLTAIAAPFVFGYARRSPLSAFIHIAAGVKVIIGSLFTDYRAQVGVKWGKVRLAEKLPPAGATVGA
ncbi:MAG TPA: hypothetical protein VNA24_24225 [Hyalangium sp.]|nr:hypothetical protein [Hyalangium sp.]